MASVTLGKVLGPVPSWESQQSPRPRAADHSCLRTAWPLRVSTLKLLVRAGMMKKATTVCSLPFTWDQEKREVGSQGRKKTRPANLFLPQNHQHPATPLSVGILVGL